MNILVVDDHEIVRCGLLYLLGAALPDAVIGQASNLAEAREQLAGTAWDIVVLDLKLPDGIGLKLLAEIKKATRTVAVLIFTVSTEEAFAARAFELGADGYLTKTSSAEEILSAIRKLLDGGKYVTASIAESLASAIGEVSSSAPRRLLSSRELEVLKMVASGATIKAIAAKLKLSEKTVGTYRSRISEKLGLSTNVALVRYALKHDLID